MLSIQMNVRMLFLVTNMIHSEHCSDAPTKSNHVTGSTRTTRSRLLI